MAKNDKKQPMEYAERLHEMRLKGTEYKVPGTNRIVRLRALDAPTLLREGKLPDILTPLVVKSVYQELTDREMKEFVGAQRGNAQEALNMIDAMDFVVKKSIADGTKIEDLTLAEKRWIFRMAMGPAELLITFRYDKELDVEPVAEGEDLRETPE
jgi:hypothetical protein